MSNVRHRVSLEVAFVPLVEQLQMLTRELFQIRERAHASDFDFEAARISLLPTRLRGFKRLMGERMESFERRLSRPPERAWIEVGVGRFDSYASALSAELSALTEELGAKHPSFTQLLDRFRDELDARVESFAESVRGRTPCNSRAPGVTSLEVS